MTGPPFKADMDGTKTGRTPRSGPSLIAVTTPRYGSRREWVSDLVEIAESVVAMQEDSEIAHAFTPIARWAASARNEYTLRRVALEVIRHAETWTELRELGIRARAIVAAAPQRNQDRARACGNAPRPRFGRLALIGGLETVGQAAVDELEADNDLAEYDSRVE